MTATDESSPMVGGCFQTVDDDDTNRNRSAGATTLATLISQIHEGLALLQQTKRSALDRALEAIDREAHVGGLLILAKAQVQHGEWIPWLEANFHPGEAPRPGVHANAP